MDTAKTKPRGVFDFSPHSRPGPDELARERRRSGRTRLSKYDGCGLGPFTARGGRFAPLISGRCKASLSIPLCGGALVLLAVFVLVGRFAGIRGFVTVVPSGAPMAFPTVVALLFAGVAFMAHGSERHGLGRGVALALLFFGIGTLGLYALGSQL